MITGNYVLPAIEELIKETSVEKGMSTQIQILISEKRASEYVGLAELKRRGGTEMQREIKFRAWRESEEEMIYSDDCLGLSGFFQNLDDCGPFMQYTGLKDKTGKEIWEGDIVRCWKKYSHIDHKKEGHLLVEGFATAIIRSNGWSFYPEELDLCNSWFFEGTEGPEFGWLNTDYEWVEVIGNIYENRELLKEGV